MAFPATTEFEGYTSFIPWSDAVAVDAAGGSVVINRRRIDERSVMDYVGTVWHEFAHKAGYTHKGNERADNECTEPHVAGDAAALVAHKRASGAWGNLPSDACTKLVQALNELQAPPQAK